MNFYFQFDGKGRVSSYSENQLGADKLQQIYLEVTPEQYALMKQNYDMEIVKSQLVFTKPQRVIDEEEATQMEIDKKSLLTKMQNNSVILSDLSNLLIKLL